MKINEILNESYDLDQILSTRLDALRQPFGAAGTAFDAQYNVEAHGYAKQNSERYQNDGVTRIQTVPDVDTAKKFNTTPSMSVPQSAGFRGREMVKQRAKIPHHKYQQIDKMNLVPAPIIPNPY